MADTYTTHYNLTKPEIGGDPDTWGNLLNADFDAIDAQMYANATYALPLTGGSLTGALTIGANGNQLLLNKSASGQASYVLAQMGGSSRWRLSLGNATAESGGNAGSDFALDSYTDAGASLTTVLSIPRSTGVAAFSARPTFAGNLAWDAGNFNPSDYAALASGPTFTGAVTSGGTVSANSTFASTNTSAVFGNSAAGTIYLRPNGTGSSSNQATLSSAGLFAAPDVQATSDLRLKDAVRTLRRGIEELRRMRPIEYVKGGREEIGFAAQDAQEVIPEAVSVNPDGFLALSVPQTLALVASAVLDLDRAMQNAGLV